MQSSFFTATKLAKRSKLLLGIEAKLFHELRSADLAAISQRKKLSKIFYMFNRSFIFFVLQSFLCKIAKHNSTVVFGNFAQEGLQYKKDKRAIEHVKDFAEFFPLADGSKISASQFMEKFGFNAQQ